MEIIEAPWLYVLNTSSVCHIPESYIVMYSLAEECIKQNMKPADSSENVKAYTWYSSPIQMIQLMENKWKLQASATCHEMSFYT